MKEMWLRWVIFYPEREGSIQNIKTSRGLTDFLVGLSTRKVFCAPKSECFNVSLK